MNIIKSEFYLCSHQGCNRKYKTEHGWVKHMMSSHDALLGILELPEKTLIKKSKKAKITSTQRERSLRKNKLKNTELDEMLEQARALRVERLELEKKIEIEKIQVAKEQLDESKRFHQIRMESREKVEEEFAEEYKKKYTDLKVSDLISNKGECIVCMDNKADSIILPCGHLQFCYVCAIRCSEHSSKCPTCRGPIVEIKKVFR